MDSEHTPRPPTLLPHQAAFVSQVLQLPRPARVLFAAPTGSGITATVAGLIRQLPPASHALVVCPAALARQWQLSLEAGGVGPATLVDTPALRSLEDLTADGRNLWASVRTAVTSIDFLKNERRLERVLEGDWDVVVIDAVHLCTTGSRQGNAARRVWATDRIPITIGISSTPTGLEWLLADGKTITIVCGGRLVGRQVVRLNYQLSQAEAALERRLGELLGHPGDVQSHKWATNVGRAWDSSMAALETTIRSTILTSEDGNEIFDSDLLEQEMAAEARDPRDPDLRSDALPAIASSGCRQLLAMLGEVSEDSKAVALLNTMASLRAEGANALAVVTDFADTAAYLKVVLEEAGWQVDALAMTGPVLEEEDDRRDDPIEGSAVTVLTSGALGLGSGGTVRHLFHYDLPWDADALLERYSAADRAGYGTTHYHMIRECDSSLLDSLTAKISLIESAFGPPSPLLDGINLDE